MTYAVPYSFVPGTKAKAEEVNANFQDVLNKIQSSSDVVTSVTERVETSLSQFDSTKLNVDFSNISDDGREFFDTKADSAKLDGEWTYSHLIAANNVSIGVGVTQTYSLADYLPNDDELYDVQLGVMAQTGTTANNNTLLYIKSDFQIHSLPLLKVITRHTNVAYAAAQSRVIVGRDRFVNVFNSASASGNSIYSLEFFGYRKVR